MKIKLLLICSALFLTACGEEVSFATQEKNRATAIENAEYNAQRFRQKNPIYNQWGLISDGDSTISHQCAQGDGWATLKLVSPDSKKLVKIKCSTVSANIQCLMATDFKTKSYASEDGRCNDKLPNPLPKIVK